jgi:hypothetical protein
MGFHLALINIFAKKMGKIWESKHFLIMSIIVVTLSSAFHMLCLFFLTMIFPKYQMRSPSCTLNCIVIIVLIGIRQNFFDAKLVTPLPIYENTLKIPFKVLLIV